jgi:hypothetical protein
MQRYIATSVQRRNSNISMNWGMVDDGVGVLPSVFFELLREIVRKTATSFLGEWAEQRQRWTSSGLAKTSQREKQEWRHCRARRQARLGNGNSAEGFLLYIAQRNATVIPTD